MRAVRVARTFPGTVHDAERCWYDTGRWPQWVDGLARVLGVDGDYPHAGARVRWESGPAGRGRVTETVLEHVPLEGQTVEVRDETITGTQSVAFAPVDGEVEIVLTFEYELVKRSLFTPLVDVLFIRGAIARSLAATLSRFGAELGETRRSRLG
jgi:Polyketide cyclase / dehydrase and lipid transport